MTFTCTNRLRQTRQKKLSAHCLNAAKNHKAYSLWFLLFKICITIAFYFYFVYARRRFSQGYR